MRCALLSQPNRILLFSGKSLKGTRVPNGTVGRDQHQKHVNIYLFSRTFDWIDMLLVGVAAVAFVSASTGSYNPTPNRLPPKPPRFSWGTVPLHMHSGNGSGTCQPHPTPTQRHTTIQILAIVSSYSLPKRVPVSLAHSSILSLN